MSCLICHSSRTIRNVFPVIHCSSLDAQNKDLGADLQTFLIVFNCVSNFLLTLAFSTNKKTCRHLCNCFLLLIVFLFEGDHSKSHFRGAVSFVKTL